MTRAEILDNANRRGFHVKLANGDITTGTVHGYKLEFPRVQTMAGSFEISWHLAERLARGETSTVLY